MINLDSLTLKALGDEIFPILNGGRIQKVQLASKTEIILHIRAERENHKLYININPQWAHICILTPQGEKNRNIIIPQNPPMFCMLLRKHMEGAKIENIVIPEHERIFEIHFSSYDELGEVSQLVLACEFMGKHSNAILYNKDKNTILGCAHNIGPEKSRERELAGGLPYIYPPKQEKLNITKITGETFLKLSEAISQPLNEWLNKTFYDISMALANEICDYYGLIYEKNAIAAISLNKLQNLYLTINDLLCLKKLNPSISKDKNFFSLISIDKQLNWINYNSINTMINDYFGYYILKNTLENTKSGLFNVIKKEILKEKNKIKNHKTIIDSAQKAENYKQKADILMANLNKIPTGINSITLDDFYNNNNPILISLMPDKTANENAQKYYKLYNKTNTAIKISKNLMEESISNLNYIESVYLSIKQSDTIQELLQIKEELINQNIIKEKINTKKTKEKINVNHYISSENIDIYVGKNNKQNDYIISKLSNPNDLWFHTQNIPGSHVLIKTNNQMTNKTIEEAAILAAYYSQGQDSSNVPVIYTKRKFIKKPNGSKPGFVIYSNEKTLFVNPDKSYLNKIKKFDE